MTHTIPADSKLSGVYDDNHKDPEAREWARAVKSLAKKAHMARSDGDITRERVNTMLARVAANAYAQRLASLSVK